MAEGRSGGRAVKLLEGEVDFPAERRRERSTGVVHAVESTGEENRLYCLQASRAWSHVSRYVAVDGDLCWVPAETRVTCRDCRRLRVALWVACRWPR